MISANRLGFWSAVLATIIAAAHFIVGILTPARSGPFASAADVVRYPYTNVAAFIPLDYYWLFPGFLLAPAFVLLMISIHNNASDDRKIFGLAGLSFALIYATIIMIDYFIQWTVVVPSILAGETLGLSLFTQYNPHGIFITFEALGYLMMSTALFSSSLVFTRGRIERLIRWLFTGSFVLAVGFFAGLSMAGYDIVALEVIVLTISWVVLITSGVLLSILFRRSGILVGRGPSR